MAGYTTNKITGEEYQFHIDTTNVAERIRQANNMSRVITLQLDGDELDAALWGLEHYKKGELRHIRALSMLSAGYTEVEVARQLDVDVSTLRSIVHVAKSREKMIMVEALHNAGYPNLEIAVTLNIPESTIRAILKP